jgi:hypothetical protein
MVGAKAGGDHHFPQQEHTMRTTQFLTTAALLALGACAPGISVRTALSPDASVHGLRTFRVLPTPQPKIAGAVASTSDPMLVNSISNRALRTDLAQEFASLGYVANDSNPDFCVAYYASTNQKLDVTYWDYGYAWRPHWWSGWGRRYGRGWGGDWGMQSAPTVTQYTEGTVIVDVIDPKTKDLLWRGQGVAAVSSNEAQYEQELKKTVEAIVDKFPAAATKVALAQ